VLGRRGQTVSLLAGRYGVPVSAIMQANLLRTTLLRAGRAYRIPVRAAAPPVARIVVPPRSLPAVTPESLASFDWPTAQTTSEPAEAR
ncbi:MAG: LysM peptidoglycan-binding domain-containing protein, partial [Acidobacteria bacterium]